MTYREKLELILAQGRPEVTSSVRPRQETRTRASVSTSSKFFDEDAEALPGWFW